MTDISAMGPKELTAYHKQAVRVASGTNIMFVSRQMMEVVGLLFSPFKHFIPLQL